MTTEKLKNILQLAASADIKKAPKAEAQKLLEAVIAGDNVTDHEWARLYKYFLPPVPRKPKNSVDWVRKFVPAKDVRFYLNYLYVSDTGEMQATNGHMLAVTANHGLSPGYYCAKSLNAADVNANYPQCDRVIDAIDLNPVDLIRVKPDVVQTKEGGFAYSYDWGDGRVILLKKYVDATLANPSSCVKMLAKDAVTGVYFEFENGDLAVVMPLRR